MTLRLGKKPAAPKPEDFKLKAVLSQPLPKPTKRFGNGTIFARDGSGWGMLANDRLGDCVPAEAAHGTMLWNHVAGHPVTFTDDAVVRFYSEVAGYDPSNPSTDQGTDMHNAMSYRRSTGIADASGTRHKIDAYVSIDPHDFDMMVSAVYVFGAVALGFEFPRSAMSQFDHDEPWDYSPDADNTIDGGHDVLAVGSLNPANEVSVITWGVRRRMTRSFYGRFNDETWVPLSFEVVRNGFGLHHLDEAKLRTLLGQYGTPNQ